MLKNKFLNVSELVAVGLWPESKPLTDKKGVNKLEELGYILFYIGKNADLYFKSGYARILMVRTERASVNDVKLSDIIKGKAILQNTISNNGFYLADTLGMNTALLEMPEEIPKDIADKSQYMSLGKPLLIKLENGDYTGIEFIFRKYLTGSLYKAYLKGEDPYGLNLPKGLSEWHEFDKPIFTPTTKGISDEPLNFEFVTEVFPEEVARLELLFTFGIDFFKERGIVLVDTKFEMFGEMPNTMLGDEVLTPESSRFISLKNFLEKKYISMDKQILRDAAKRYKWTEGVEKGDIAIVVIPNEVKENVIAGYQTIIDMTGQGNIN